MHGIAAFLDKRPSDNFKLPGKYAFSTAVNDKGETLYVKPSGQFRWGAKGKPFYAKAGTRFSRRSVSVYRAGRASMESANVDSIVAATFCFIPASYVPGMPVMCSGERSEADPSPAAHLKFYVFGERFTKTVDRPEAGDVTPVRHGRRVQKPTVENYQPIEYETWAPHPTLPYLISSHNRLRHIKQTDIVMVVPKVEYASIHIEGKLRAFHRLVCEAFHGLSEREGFNVVDHRDGDASNNHPLNLCWEERGSNNANRKYVKRKRSKSQGGWEIAVVPLGENQVTALEE